jgi:hypothetical protein
LVQDQESGLIADAGPDELFDRLKGRRENSAIYDDSRCGGHFNGHNKGLRVHLKRGSRRKIRISLHGKK